jgi:hypothetical protein
VDADTVGRVLPDGSADVVWADDEELFVAGPDTGPVRRNLRAGSTIVGIRFRPGAAGAALGLPAAELRDSRVPLEAVWNGRATDLAERLEATPRKREALEAEVLRQLPRTEPPDRLVLDAIRLLGRPGTRVRSLSDALFVSERHLRRVFREAVGYGPKTLDRVLRFQRFLSLRGPGPPDAGDAAALGAHSRRPRLVRKVQDPRPPERHHARPWTRD